MMPQLLNVSTGRIFELGEPVYVCPYCGNCYSASVYIVMKYCEGKTRCDCCGEEWTEESE